MRELKAADLYGGKEKIMKAMREIIRERLSNFTPEELWEVQNYLPIGSGVIHKIKNLKEDVEVDYDLFSMFSVCCDVIIWDVVGKPVFDEKSKAFWENQMIENPMLSTGLVIDLDMYVSCVLISEIGSKEFKNEWWRETTEDFIEKVKNIQEYEKTGVKGAI